MGALPAGVPMLRPLSVGEILDASFKVYGRNFMTMARAILVVAIPFSLISAVVRASISTSGSSSSAFPTISTNSTTTPSTSAAVASLLVAILTVVSASVSTAIIYRVVGDAYLGQPPSWRVALGGGLRKANSVLWLTLVTVICFAGLIMVPLVLVILAAQASIGLGIILGVATGIPAVVACIWLVVGAQLAVPSLMLEDYRGWKALRRGVRLCRHHWWRCFGCILLVGLIVGILSNIVSGVALVLLLSLAHSEVARAVVFFIAGVLTTVIFSPITASALVVLSIDMRVRKEGYDIQLLASQLGSEPGSAALSFFPRPPVMWGGPASPWAKPGPPAWGQQGAQGWGQPTAPGWTAPTSPSPPGPGWPLPPPGAPWDPANPGAFLPPLPGSGGPPPPRGQVPGSPPFPPPPPNFGPLQGWVPAGQPEPPPPPPLFEAWPPPPSAPSDPPPTQDTPGSD